jgi:hypothetical protein
MGKTLFAYSLTQQLGPNGEKPNPERVLYFRHKFTN